MCPTGDPQADQALQALLREVREQFGCAALRVRATAMTDSGGVTAECDGQPLRLRMRAAAVFEAFDVHRRATYRREGSPWFVAEARSHGEQVTVTWSSDAPPRSTSSLVRSPGAYIRNLELFPRSADRVPGWMKVELAAVGAWDLVSDEPRWNDEHEPTGRPQTPASVGVEPPPGAEHALPTPTGE